MNTPEDFLKGRNIKDRTIRVLTFNDKNYMLTDLMLDYAKVYAETLVKKCDLADVGGSLRELADKYEMDALNRYETSDHALSHIHMAAQARYGFEDGWEAAKKQ